MVSDNLSIAPRWQMWLVWSVGVFGYLLAVTNRTSLSAVGVDAAARFNADASTLSMFAVLQLAIYGLMQIPVGLLLDRYGARPIITIGLALMAAGQLVMAFSPNVGIAIAARMLLGAGDAGVFPSVLRLIATWFPAQKSPIMVQLTSLVGQLGQLISVLPMALLLHSTSWSITFGSLAGICLIAMVLVFVLVRSRPASQDIDVSINTATGAIQAVTSAADLRVNLRDAWSHPGTRLAFWSHFTTPFAGSAFLMLWGFPFLTIGEQLTTPQTSGLIMASVIFSMLIGPVIGAISGRKPLRRSTLLVLPIVGIQIIAWLTVIVWPGQAPFWLCLLLVLALATGGPASMIAFDHARTHNPSHRLSTATGIVNVGGFLAAIIAMFFIGLALDIQGAGLPESYTLNAFRVAFLTQLPLWLLGAIMIVVERRRTRARIGLHRKIAKEKS